MAQFCVNFYYLACISPDCELRNDQLPHVDSGLTAGTRSGASRTMFVVADRKDFGSWLEGTPQGNSSTQAERAHRLGLPETGSGSLAGLGRRVGGVMVDWAAASAVSFLLFDFNEIATLLIFGVAHFLFVSSIGYTLGHFLFGLKVRPREDAAGFVGFVRGFIRALLLCLVLPAVVWDAEGRGLHDKAANTIIVRR